MGTNDRSIWGSLRKFAGSVLQPWGKGSVGDMARLCRTGVKDSNHTDSVVARLACTVVFSTALVSKAVTWVGPTSPGVATGLDPVTGLNKVQTFWMGGALDVLGLVTVLVRSRPGLKGAILTWIGALFLLYHLVLVLGTAVVTCPCLPGLAELMRFPPLAVTLLALAGGLTVFLYGCSLLPLPRDALDYRNWNVRWLRFGFLPQLSNSTRVFLSSGLGAVLVLSVGLTAPVRDGAWLGGDEGTELIKGRLAAHGYPLYDPLWSEQPPLLTHIYAVMLGKQGQSPVGPRLFSLSCFLLLMVVVSGHIASRFGIGAAVLFQLFLLSCPSVMRLSVAAMQEVPAASLAMLAGILGQHALRTGTTLRWMLAAFLGITALMIKLTAVLYLAAFFLSAAVWTIRSKEVAAFRRLVRTTAIVMLVSLVALVAWGADARHLLLPHLEYHAVEGLAAKSEFRFTALEFGRHPALFVSGGLAIVWLAYRRLPGRCGFEWTLGVLLLAVYTLHRPWWYYYHLNTGIALALVSSVALADCAGTIWRRLRNSVPANAGCLGIAYLCMILLVITGVASATRVHEAFRTLRQASLVEQSALITRLREYRGKVQWAFSDRPMYLFHAGLLVPPELAVMSLKRYWSLQITAAQVYALLEQYRVGVVVMTRENRGRIFRDFEEQLPHYKEVGGDADLVIYERVVSWLGG